MMVRRLGTLCALLLTSACGARSSLSVGRSTTDAGASDAAASTCAGTLSIAAAPTGFALDAEHVYYLDTSLGGIARVGKTGGAPVLLAQETRAVRNVVVDQDWAYWSATDATRTGHDVLVYRVSKSGGPVMTLRRFGVSTMEPPHALLAADDRYVTVGMGGGVHWIDKGNPSYGWRAFDAHSASSESTFGVVSSSGSLTWMTGRTISRTELGPADGVSTTLFEVSVDRLRALAVDADDTPYWLMSNGWDYDLFRGTSSLSADKIFPTVKDVGLAIDADALYVSARGGIVRIAKSSGDVRTLAPNASADFMQVDADCLYYTTHAANVSVLASVPRR